jgi:hypothetical protein
VTLTLPQHPIPFRRTRDDDPIPHRCDLAWLCLCGRRVPQGGLAWRLPGGRWRCPPCVDGGTR